MIYNDVISSRSNPVVKWASSLSEKKGRDENDAFIVEGIKLSLEAISSGYEVSHIFIDESKREQYLPIITSHLDVDNSKDICVYFLAESAFAKISTEKAPQGVITVLKKLDISNYADIIYKEDFFQNSREKAIVLSSLRDPSNIGAIIRSAAAFGYDRVILSSDCADIYNPKTMRSSMGGIFKLKISIVSDLKTFIEAARHSGRTVYAAELCEGAMSVCDVKLSATDLVVIGNEGHGIESSISSACNASLYIPIDPDVESLNASVAASVLMWEQSR